MTDKEKIRAEIEKVKVIIQSNRAQGAFAESYLIGQESVLEHFENFVNSMQEEPVSKDFKIALEKKVREAQDWTYIEEEGGECPLNEEFDADDLEEFARWGAQWQKEQMLAKAVDVTVHIGAGGYPYIPQMELWDYEKDEPLAEEGDIVKVLVYEDRTHRR